MDYKHLLEMLKPVVWQASDQVMKIYERQDFQQTEKVDKSPITEADLASHKILTEAIALLTPEITIISEENKEQLTIENQEHFWVIDPLDGTKEFIAANGEFTINVALVSGDSPILGIVCTPVFGEIYFAIRGAGAFVQRNGAEAVAISSQKKSLDAANLKVLCSRSHLNSETEAYINNLDNPEIIKKGGSMKFMDVASGRAHVYPRFGPTMEWDTCAPQIIVEEAGGSLIDQKTQQTMRYGKDNFLNNYFVVFA